MDPRSRTDDHSAARTQGETHGQRQEPVEAGERDSTRREQERHDGRSAGHDPAAPDAAVEDSLTMAHSPDAAYGQREDQAGTADAGMPTQGGESQGPGREFEPRDQG
jgi:hypothetical protein